MAAEKWSGMTGIKIDMSTNAVDEEIALLGVFPEIADKHYRPALKRVVAQLKNTILATMPHGTTGVAERGLKTGVTGKGLRIKGTVGWPVTSQGNNSANWWYVRVLEAGAKKHAIGPKNAQALHLPGGKFYANVMHPGVRARRFVEAAADRMGPLATPEFAAANEAIVKELAV